MTDNAAGMPSRLHLQKRLHIRSRDIAKDPLAEFWFQVEQHSLFSCHSCGILPLSPVRRQKRFLQICTEGVNTDIVMARSAVQRRDDLIQRDLGLTSRQFRTAAED